MSYRNGIYVAFNGCGTTNPIDSDIKYFNLLKAWAKNTSIDFTFNDSHSKTYQVRDTSKEETLKRRLLERLANSKSLLLLITENSCKSRGWLNWEIDQAVTRFNLPVIVVYTMTKDSDFNPLTLRQYWPSSLRNLIDKEIVRSIHIPFCMDILSWVLSYFSIHNPPLYPITVLTNQYYAGKGLG